MNDDQLHRVVTSPSDTTAVDQPAGAMVPADQPIDSPMLVNQPPCTAVPDNSSWRRWSVCGSGGGDGPHRRTRSMAERRANTVISGLLSKRERRPVTILSDRCDRRPGRWLRVEFPGLGDCLRSSALL